MTHEAQAAMEAAYRIAAEMGDSYVGGEHLLLALTETPDGSDAGRCLDTLGAGWEPAGRTLMTMHRHRTCPPPRVQTAGLPARKLKRRLRGEAGRIKRLVYGLANYRKPFIPYLIFRRRTLDAPYPFYTRLRSSSIYWDPLASRWIVTGYADVVAALTEPRLSQRVFAPSAWSEEGLPPLVEREFRSLHNSLDRQMLFQDAPDQPRQRATVAKRFTPRVIGEMRATIERTAEEMLDALAPAGRMEAIADLAIPFPLTIIARMLGLPQDELRRFKKWSADYFLYLNFECTLAQDLAAHHSVREATDYFRALIPERRNAPQNDLLTLLLQADDKGEYLPEEDVVANCLLLLATGHENTTRLIGSGLLALLRHPDQLARLREDPSLIGSAVEELLRYDSPVQWTLRHMHEDFEWRGHALKKGQSVQIGIAAANRDPAQFPDPDRLDIARAENRHVAFGHGAHFCLGAALTRLETQILFSKLIARFPSLRLDGSPEWLQDGLTFRGPKSLPLRWD